MTEWNFNINSQSFRDIVSTQVQDHLTNECGQISLAISLFSLYFAKIIQREFEQIKVYLLEKSRTANGINTLDILQICQLVPGIVSVKIMIIMLARFTFLVSYHFLPIRTIYCKLDYTLEAYRTQT